MSQCKECPYIIKNIHNEKMINNIERLFDNGSLKTKKHKCHMKDTNLWNNDNKNICIGSINNELKTKK